MRRGLAAGLIGMALFGAMPARSSITTESRTYVGSVSGAWTYASCAGEGILGTGAGPDGQGAVCFAIPPAAVTLDTTIADDVFADHVLSIVYYFDANGTELGTSSACDGVGADAIPPTARFVWVKFPQPTLGIYPACPFFGTKGTITATFS